MSPECIFFGGDVLGEVPIWDAEGNRVWWLDVSRARLHSLELATSRHEMRKLPGKTVGGWAFRSAGGAVVALDDGLHALSSDTLGPVLARVPPGDLMSSHRVNEACTDFRGRLWLGVMERAGHGPSGGLYRINPDGTVLKALGGISTPNGICFSPDGTQMYFCDSARRQIWAFPFDADDGVVGDRRVFCDLAAWPGMPDGAAVDAEGFVWSACFGAGQVMRIDPKGRIEQTVSLPVSKVTSLAFGGADLRTLFITTASGKLTAEQRATEPLAGGLFAMDVAVCGFLQPKFIG